MVEYLESNWSSFIIKWNSAEYAIDSVTSDCSVFDLKYAIYKETGVEPERQKLLGLKSNGIPVRDETLLSECDIRSINMKILMICIKEGDIENMDLSVRLSTEHFPKVFNFHIEKVEMKCIPIQNRKEFLVKIEKRVKEYKVKILSQPRPGKKLLVLDIDYTLMSNIANLRYRKPRTERWAQLIRPYLHEFLTIAYEDYDIVIWSATRMKWIKIKMKALGVERNPNYKIVFYLDISAMISVHTHKFFKVKPLGVIWGKFKEYTPKNTIMFDDICKNFLMNPQNGLRIKAFHQIHKNRDTDKELYFLAKYLKKIAELDDLSGLNHRHWFLTISIDDFHNI